MWEGGNVCTGSRKLGIHAQIEKRGCTGSRRLGIHAQIGKKGLHRFPEVGHPCANRKKERKGCTGSGKICTGPGQLRITSSNFDQ